jgi:cleavage stimulation factor subunit 3
MSEPTDEGTEKQMVAVDGNNKTDGDNSPSISVQSSENSLVIAETVAEESSSDPTVKDAIATDTAVTPQHDTPQPDTPNLLVRTKRKRMAHDIIGQLEDDLVENPQDVDKWRALIGELKSKEKLDDLRAAYEKMVVQFPTSAEVWIDYLDTEQSHDEFYKVEQLFARCLAKVLNVNLWNYYLGYVRRINNVNNDGEKAITTISQAFEFVLDRIGHDKASGKLWADYINFIKTKEASSPWEQQQRMDLLRKTYRRAICIPLNNLETLWQGYNSFENNLNKSTARKFIADRSAAYMTARSCLRELDNITGALDKTTIPRARKWTPEESQQAQKWMDWIEWETKNPLETDDQKIVDARVSYAYAQATMTLRYFPDIWFNAANYQFSKARDAEGTDLLVDGLNANATSFLLTFKIAQVYENEARFQDMKDIFEKLINVLQSQRQTLELQRKELAATPRSRVLKRLDTKLSRSALDITIAYTEYMKVTKRALGIREARRVFGEGRRLSYSTYHIYVEAAMMEFYSNKEAGIATKIFELGLKRFAEVAEYVKTYFSFLILVNDEPNARALFEKSVIKMTPEAARPLYEHFLEYEANHGELSGLLKLGSRMAELYPDESAVSLFSRTYRVLDYSPITEVDLGGRLASHTRAVSPAVSEGIAAVGESDSEARPRKKSREAELPRTPVIEGVATVAIPAGIISLLKTLPPASAYDMVPFDAVKLAKLLKETPIPDSLLGA